VTTLCSGGSSSAVDGFGEAVSITSAAIGGILNKYNRNWVIPLAGLLGGATYELTTFCASDPPALPTLTAIDAAELLQTLNPQLQQAAAQKFLQFIGYYAWFTFCKCDSVATPAPDTTPTEPPTWPTVDPPQIAPIPSAGCATFASPIQSYPSAGWGSWVIPTTEPVAAFSPSPFTPRVQLPTGATTMAFTWSIGGGAPSTITSTFTYNFYDSAGTFISGSNRTINSSFTTFTVDVAVPSTAVFFQCYVIVGGGTVTSPMLLSASATFYCNGQVPGAPATPCCPPDPTLALQVQQILQMVTLIQRQAAPFGYVYGDNHTGLTGHGSFAVSSLIGVSVDVTTLPSSYGRIDAASPAEYFDLGFITLGTADGYEHSRRIDHDGTLLIPPGAGLFTAVGYSLSPGVEVAIRELVREP